MTDLKVLVVEDDLSIQKAICTGLRKFSYAVDAASGGEEALRSAQVNDYDAIVLDLNLPKVDGIDVLTEIRRHDQEMPNGTDLTSFLDAGFPGLNFAVAEGVEHYHQPSDSFENLNRGTAYNYLRTVLEMADYGGHAQFQDRHSTRNSVFFTLLPGNLVLMSDIIAYCLSAFVLLASLCWLYFQIRRGRVRVRHIFSGTGWLLGTMAASGLLYWGVAALLTGIWKLGESTNNDTVYMGTAAALGLGVLAVWAFRMRKQSLAEAIAELLPLLGLLVAGTAKFYVEISYLFTFPVLGMLIVAVMDRYRIGRLIASTVFGVGVLLLYVPVCWLIYVMFMLPAAPATVAIGILPVAILAAFFPTGNPSVGKKAPPSIQIRT